MQRLVEWKGGMYKSDKGRKDDEVEDWQRCQVEGLESGRVEE